MKHSHVIKEMNGGRGHIAVICTIYGLMAVLSWHQSGVALALTWHSLPVFTSVYNIKRPMLVFTGLVVECSP